MELIYSGSFESLPVGASASMAEDSDGSYDPSDEEDDPPSSCMGGKTKEAAKKFSGMLRRWLHVTGEQPLQDAPQSKSKTRCKRDLATLDLQLAPQQPSGKRQRKPVEHFEAGSAQCFVRAKATPPSLCDDLEPRTAPRSVTVTRSDWCRSDKERDRKKATHQAQSHKKRRDEQARKQAAQIAELAGTLDNYEELSWRQRRNVAIKSFVGARQFGYGKLVAYHIAAFACGANERAVRDWASRWGRLKEGFEASFSWGGQSAPSILMEEDVIAASRTWWRQHAPKKGAPSFRSVACLLLTSSFRRSASSDS